MPETLTLTNKFMFVKRNHKENIACNFIFNVEIMFSSHLTLVGIRSIIAVRG